MQRRGHDLRPDAVARHDDEMRAVGHDLQLRFSAADHCPRIESNRLPSFRGAAKRRNRNPEAQEIPMFWIPVYGAAFELHLGGTAGARWIPAWRSALLRSKSVVPARARPFGFVPNSRTGRGALRSRIQDRT